MNLNHLLELALSFARVGIGAFGGGFSVLPLIENELVTQMSWITAEEFRNIFALSQVTPGPIAINAATFIGFREGGILGSVVATASMVTAPLILLIITVFVLEQFGEANKSAFKKSMRPAVSALLSLALIPPLLSVYKNGAVTALLFICGVYMVNNIRFFRTYPIVMFLLFGAVGAVLLR